MSKTLTIYLAADLRKLNSGLREAQSDMGRFERSMGNLSSTMGSMLGPALLGAAAAAGYMAVTLGVDGVKAAMEDEAAAAKLAKTMENLGLANDTTAVEAMIDAQQRQFGIADDLLRPAMDRLIRATGDAAKANTTLQLAMDISAGTGKSLDAVVQALGKAYDGNTAGLSRLGAGLDKALLATGDMDAITAQLANTFNGQAQTAANTYQGQLARLSVGFSELQESFGSGFLNALGNANDKTETLMDTMKSLEPQTRKLGDAFGKAAVSLATYVGDTVDAGTATQEFANSPSWDSLRKSVYEVGKSNEFFNLTMLQSVPGIGQYLPSLYRLSGGFEGVAKAIGLAVGELESMGGGDFNTPTSGAKGLAIAAEAARDRLQANRYAADAAAEALAGYNTNANDTTSSSTAATTATDLLTTAFELQSKVVEDGSAKLSKQVSELRAANTAVAQYASTLSGQLLGGINLTTAQETGTELGIGTMAAFDAQIAQANWFGNVLEEVKRQNGSQALIDYMAQAGPAAGGKFGQEAIDNGLIPEFSSKLDAVVSSANTLAQAMVPEYLRAGVDSAEQNLAGMATTFGENADKLAKIGKRIGKTIGDNSRVEILRAVAEAIAEAEASRTAAEARRSASAAASNLLSDQQIAQSFARIIQTSNNRTGYSMGVPIPSPVLG